MHNYEHDLSIGIVGARGYSGLDLARLVLRHPHARLTALFASDAHDFKLSDYLLEAKAKPVPTFSMNELEKEGAKCQVIFLATPAEVSIQLAPQILKMGVHVIDLSGAFRLPAEQYSQWYGFTHEAPSELKKAQYGLVPFSKPFKTEKATLVANPGCYVTSVLMGILPLLKSKVIDASTLVIDAKSGTSGGGKKPSESLLFTEVDGECIPYKIGKHQHFPEICHYAQTLGATTIDPIFSTSLIPTRRGIIAGIYARLQSGKTEEDVAAAFESAYDQYPLVRFAALGKNTSAQSLQLKKVVGSARTHIFYQVSGDKLYLYSLIDNLLKGAASQAIENLNRLYDLSPETGLLEQEGTL
jgi:N-acetyl-gamma-glutamyl-phosphate reductase